MDTLKRADVPLGFCTNTYKKMPNGQYHNVITLTNDEIETLKYCALPNNVAIAHRLNLSLRALEGRFTRMFIKLNVKTKVQALIVAAKKNIISLEDVVLQ